MILFKVLLVLVAGVALFALGEVLERSLKRPGFASELVGVLFTAAGVYLFVNGQRLMPALFIVMALSMWFRPRHRRSPAGS